MQKTKIFSSENPEKLEEQLNKFFEERNTKKDFIKGVWFAVTVLNGKLIYSVMSSYSENVQKK